MFKPLIKHICNLVTAFAVTLFFSCSGRGEAVKKLNFKSQGPVAEGTGVRLKYTDSGKVVAVLRAPRVKDFSDSNFPFKEFPEGVKLEYFDPKNGDKSTITSKYAISYEATSLIDLQNDVVLVTSEGARLEGEQIYWDQSSSWVFTDRPYILTLPDGSTNKGDLFDSNQDFTDFVSLNNRSKQYIKEENKE